MAPFESVPVFAFVGDGPHEDTRVVPVSGDHLSGKLDDLGGVAEVARDAHPTEIGFVFDVETNLVGMIDELRERWIVRSADRIEICSLNHVKVEPLDLRRHRPTHGWVLVVVAGALELDRNVVDQDIGAVDLGLSEAKGLLKRPN